MVDESARIWVNIDDIRKSLSDHCVRITKLEQEHIYSSRTKKDIIIYLLAGISIMSVAVGYLT